MTAVESRIQAVRAELNDQLPGLHDVIVRPDAALDAFEFIALEGRLRDKGAPAPSWGSVLISRATLLGGFADFGATVETATDLLRQQLDDVETPASLPADTAVLDSAPTAPADESGPVPPADDLPTISADDQEADPQDDPGDATPTAVLPRPLLAPVDPTPPSRPASETGTSSSSTSGSSETPTSTSTPTDPAATSKARSKGAPSTQPTPTPTPPGESGTDTASSPIFDEVADRMANRGSGG